MKKAFSFVVLSTFAAVVLTGCDDITTPKGTVLTAGFAISRNNFVGFRSTLTGEAASRFGTYAGMAKLKKEFAGAKHMTTGQIVHMSSIVTGKFTDDTYTVDVLDGDKRLMIATVKCRTKQIYIIHHANPRNPNDLDTEGYEDDTSCKISQLN